MTPPTDDGSDDVSVPAPFGGPPPPYPQQPSLPTTPDRPCSWPAALAIGTFTVGVVGVLRFSPFWALVSGLASVFAVRSGLPDPMPRLLAWTHTDTPRWTKHPRVAVAAFFIMPPLALTAAWAAAQPTTLWSPWALIYGVAVGLHVYGYALHRGGGTRPRRWWWVWLSMASLVILFFAGGGPFRARWAYCESRLTAAVTADEPVDIPTTGRFCWHDAVERTVDGERRLYISGADDGDGTGLVYSPAGEIEHSPGLELVRSLGGGWYYFEEGSAVKGFWFDG